MDWGRVGEFILGSVPAVVAVGAFLIRIDRRMSLFLVEHEMLMSKYAKDSGIKLSDLPTRSKGFHV